MQTTKEGNVNNKITLQVMDGLTVQLYSNSQFDFLMDTETVAKGYGLATQSILSHKSRYCDEFKSGTHFTTAAAIAICNSDLQMPHNKLFWTKAGVVRLGFFIKSERAKAFRDWAEKIVLDVFAPKANLPAPTKRKHNRLSPGRLLDIMADICQIENSELRNRIANKLKGGVHV